MIKTSGRRTLYYCISIPIITALMIFILCFFTRKKVLFAEFTNDDNKTYFFKVKTDGGCGNCLSDEWSFYNEDNKMVLALNAPLRANNTIYYKVYFNYNHYSKFTNTSTFGETYKDIVTYVKTSKNFTCKYKNSYIVCTEHNAGFTCLKLLIALTIITVIVILIPNIKLSISKKDIDTFIKAVTLFAETGSNYYTFTVKEGDEKKLSVEIGVGYFKRDSSVTIHMYYYYHGVCKGIIRINDNSLDTSDLSSCECAWFKWYLHKYVRNFYTYAVQENADKILEC